MIVVRVFPAAVHAGGQHGSRRSEAGAVAVRSDPVKMLQPFNIPHVRRPRDDRLVIRDCRVHDQVNLEPIILRHVRHRHNTSPYVAAQVLPFKGPDTILPDGIVFPKRNIPGEFVRLGFGPASPAA